MINFAIAFLASIAASADDRSHEGSWYVADTTDNNTGEREVYAFTLHLQPNDPDYVTLTLRCWEGTPRVAIEWDNLSFPSRAVFEMSASSDPDAEPEFSSFVFVKSVERDWRGLQADAGDSARIAQLAGDTDYLILQAHSTSGARALSMEITGMASAWARVDRHCPSTKVPLPPL